MKDHEAIKLAIEELQSQEQHLHRLQHRKKQESRQYTTGSAAWLKPWYQSEALAMAAGVLAKRIQELKKIVEPYQQTHSPQ